MDQLLLVLLYLLLYVLLVVLNVNQLIAHLTHDLGMLAIVSGCTGYASILLHEQLLALSHCILLSEEVVPACG